MNDTVLMINASFGKSASQKEIGLENKIKASMKAVKEGNWMETNEDALFRSSLAGVYLDVGQTSEDGMRLTESVNALKSFNAFIAAAQAGLNPEVPKVSGELLPLMGWWHELTDSKGDSRCPDEAGD